MPKSKKTRAAIAWLESGAAPSDRGGEVVAGLILLAYDLPLDVRLEACGDACFGADMEMALLVLAQRAEALDFLVHMRDHAGHKTTAKQAKKFLFRAKQQGADVPTDGAPARAVRLARQPDPLPSYCSTFDRDGGQVVVLGGWDSEHGAWALVGIVQGDHGLSTVAWLPKMSRSRLKGVLNSLAGERSEELVEVNPGFAAGRLKWALSAAEATPRRIEGDRSRARRLLQDVEPLVDFCLADTEPTAAGLPGCAALLQDSCFEPWLLSLPRLMASTTAKVVAAATAAAATATDNVSAMTDEALISALCLHAESWYDTERRSRLAARLEITAMLLAELRRNHASDAALAVARALVDERLSIADIPVFRAAFAVEDQLEMWRTSLHAEFSNVR